MGVVKKRWAFKVGLVGLFEIDYKTPCHDLLEFFHT
jgi:hypothetical protein